MEDPSPGDTVPGGPRTGDTGPGDTGPGGPRTGDTGPGDTGPRGRRTEPDAVQQVLERVGPGSEAESLWVQDVFTFITRHLAPLLCGHAPHAADTGGTDPCDTCVSVCVCVVKMLQDKMAATHTLPVSYRLVSISDLVSQQHVSCVSHVSWSTNQQRACVKEAELRHPGSKALPRVNLLLIGCLREGRGGEWRLTDGSGSVRCECLSPCPRWLHHPVLLPHWNYIPHDAAGGDQAEGCVELIGSPVLLCPGPEQGLAAGMEEAGPVVGVREAAGVLHSRVRGRRVSVRGQVGSVCPLLVVSGTSFFIFTLRDNEHRVPVLVKDAVRLWWSQCVCVGQSVCVTALRVCVLRGWRGNHVLCVTERSEIHTDDTHTHTPVEDTHSQPDTPPTVTSHTVDHEEAEPERDVKTKQSRVISYQGVVTEVVSRGAGLYVMDRQVGLCLAYQPAPRRKLRVGDHVELHHVHFLYRPCPDFPPSMLCTCLRSSLRVTSFSGVGGASSDSTCPGDGVLPRLLLEMNMGVSDYLWACHLSSRLSHSLSSSVLKQQCVCVLSWKLMKTVKRRGRGGRRDIYSEMLDEPHCCPLSQYIVDPAVHQYISLSELLQSDRWSSLLPPGSGLNPGLSWSCRTLSSEPRTGDALRRRPLLLVGLLQLPSHTRGHTHTLMLRDGTAAVSCVVTETSEDEEGGQRAVFNTAWIGCLVCVHHFTMVTETLDQSESTTDQHLEEDRVYLQFSLDHLHILSPSVSMVTHLSHKGAESDGGRKRRRDDSDSSVVMTTGPEGGASPPCVSLVFMVEQKEGVAWRNTGAGPDEEGAGLTLHFSVRAAVIGPVVRWRRDPKNEPMTDREAERGRGNKVSLLLSGVCCRWFPVLHPGCFYRLVAVDTEDPRALIGCGVSGCSGVELQSDSTLVLQFGDWRIHSLTHTLLLDACRQPRSTTVLSVSDVIDCSSDLVCFQALVCDRISVNHRTTDRHTHTGVRLTMCDQSGRSLQVYLDPSHAPCPPGLLPGNTLLLTAVQRRLSRSGAVYFSLLPVSSVTVMSLGDMSSTPPPPMMHLGLWALKDQRVIVGRVRVHVVCVLILQLQWRCSLCGSVYVRSCSSSQCRSTSSVFESKAKLVIDDGTGEARVWVSGDLVRAVLGLADPQWEGLQRAVRVKGHIRVYPRGRSLVCDSDSDDSLVHFLLFVCSSDVVCRQFSLTCRKHSSHRTEGLRTFSRGDRLFITTVSRPLQLTCLSLPDM